MRRKGSKNRKACRLRALNLKDRRGITDGVVQVPSAV